MAGCRPLTRPEERKLLAVVRRLPPRDRCLVTAQWFTAFRISSTCALTVGHVWRNDAIVSEIALAPRHIKGKRGRTLRVPVSPELARALKHHLWWLRLKFPLTPDLPLFPSRQVDAAGSVRPITRVQAYMIIMRAFAAAGIEDDGRLGTHALRKTTAAKAYAHCKDMQVLREMLGHASVATSELYLEKNTEGVKAAFAACDFTRRPRPKPELAEVPTPALVTSVPVESNVLPFHPPAAPMPAHACSVY